MNHRGNLMKTHKIKGGGLTGQVPHQFNNHGLLIFLLGLGLLMAWPKAAQAFPCNAQPTVVTSFQNNTPGIDTKLFVDALTADLSGLGVKGYVATLRDRYGEEVANVRMGLARTACDPGGQINFSSMTETPWGSVSKLLTTAAVIKAAGQYGIDLDSPAKDYLPYAWRTRLHSRFEDVTLAEFLSHQAGFRHSSCLGRTVSDRLIDGDLVNCAAAGDPATPPPPEVGVRSYSNMLGIYSRVLAYMIEPDLMHVHEQNVLASFGPFGSGFTMTAYDQQIEPFAAAIYNAYVQQEVLAPIGVSATCDMATNAGGNHTLWFSSGTDDSGAMPPDRSDDCASGAWIMSSQEMSRFLYHLKHSQAILSESQYQRMELSTDDRLGWGLSGWQTGDVYSHNGSWSSTKAWVMALPGGFTATMVLNTPPPEGSVSPSHALKDAYIAARIAAVSDTVTAIYGTWMP